MFQGDSTRSAHPGEGGGGKGRGTRPKVSAARPARAHTWSPRLLPIRFLFKESQLLQRWGEPSVGHDRWNCKNSSERASQLWGPNSAGAPGTSWWWLNRNWQESGRGSEEGKEGAAPDCSSVPGGGGSGGGGGGSFWSDAKLDGRTDGRTDQTCLGFLRRQRRRKRQRRDGDC